MRGALPGLCLGLVALCLPLRGAAELYRWVDAEGRLHVTDDLSHVPPEVRRTFGAGAAEEGEEAGAPSGAGWNEIRPVGPPPAARAAPAGAAASTAGESARRHTIPVGRAGLEIDVLATLNGHTQSPFKVDTGATLNTIPRRLVEELGIPTGSSSPTTLVRGISGQPILVPLVTLDEVRIGDAAVRHVEMAVLDTLEYGLLGMPFFNHFRVRLDPGAGTLTLEELDLNAVEGVYGGYGEDYWRSRFRMIRAQLEAIHRRRDRVPSEYTGIHERLRRAESHWREQYEQLELRASRAGVPRAWRE